MVLELNRIYNEDCLRGGYIPDGSIDLVVTDLPYGMTRNKWDSEIDLDGLWALFRRVVKPNGAVLLFGQRKFAAKLIMSNLKWFRYDIVYKKRSVTGFLNANHMPLSAHEQILVFYRRLPTYNPQFLKGKPYVSGSGCHSSSYGKYEPRVTRSNGDRYPIDVVEFGRDKKAGLHPTQKPVSLIEYLIKTYSNEGDVVLDCCMDAGTTAVACLNTNRRFIGFETERRYCDIANRRIAECLQND